jgi:hypothetical protein
MAAVGALAGIIAEQQYAVRADRPGPFEDGPFRAAGVGSGDYVAGAHGPRPPDGRPPDD